MKLKSFLIILLTLTCAVMSVYGQQDDVEYKFTEKKDSLEIEKTEAATRGKTPRLASDRTKASIFKDEMDSKSEIFYSNAKMYVAKNEVWKDPTDHSKGKVDASSMFVLGTVKYDDKAQIVQIGETSLTGDFVSVKGSDVASTQIDPLFVMLDGDGDITDWDYTNTGGIIKFVGQWNKQEIVREDLKGTKLLVPENKTKSGGILNFPTIRVEKEAFESLTDFPLPLAGLKPGDPAVPYDVKNMGVVTVRSNVAMSANQIDIAGGYRFNVDVVSSGLDESSGITTPSSSDYYKLNSAYVDIRSMASTRVTNGVTSNHVGHSEVDMKLYNYDAAKHLPFDVWANPEDWTNPHAATSDTDLNNTNRFNVAIRGEATTASATFLRGFASPFETLRADYMYYHVLTRPGANSITSGNGPIGPADTKMSSGVAYFQAMDVSYAYFDDINEKNHKVNNPSILTLKGWEYRERGGYYFSRLVRELKFAGKVKGKESYGGLKGFNLFTAVGTADVTQEAQRFVTGPVQVAVYGPMGGIPGANRGAGLNYLANPYMTPISLKQLLGVDAGGNLITTEPGGAAATQPFLLGDALPGVYGAYQLDASKMPAAGNLVVKPMYWTVNTGLVATTKILGVPAHAYNVKYDVVTATNSATSVSTPGQRYLEPLQVFMVQAAQAGIFTFTDKLKVTNFDNMKPFDIALAPKQFVKPPQMPAKSSRAETSGVEEFHIPDWFIIEALVTDGDAMSVDRTAVRLFDTATEGWDSNHDIKKAIKYDASLSATKSADASEEVFAPSNVIYTSTPSGEPLLANSVNFKTKEIPLHYLPGENEQNITFTALGVDGFERIEGVWLVDTYTDEKTKLEEGTEYSFTSLPTDNNEDMKKNRFFLRFFDDGEDGPSLTENPITCYYSGSTLHIGGLNENDLGSKVYIYDLQGRLMGNTVINNYPGMEYRKSLGQGTFVVKIVGERNYDTKFVNLQNY